MSGEEESWTEQVLDCTPGEVRALGCWVALVLFGLATVVWLVLR